MPTITGELTPDQKNYVRRNRHLSPRELAVRMETAQSYVEQYIGWQKPARHPCDVTNETPAQREARIDREFGERCKN